jgi:ABC-type nickel/cobalt efflux system permease component RcnA
MKVLFVLVGLGMILSALRMFFINDKDQGWLAKGPDVILLLLGAWIIFTALRL